MTKAYETYLAKLESFIDELRGQDSEIDAAAGIIADCIAGDIRVAGTNLGPAAAHGIS